MVNCWREIEAALTIGYGPVEDYGFHALEAHQCMIVRRHGGEAGIREIQVAIAFRTTRQILEISLRAFWFCVELDHRLS